MKLGGSQKSSMNQSDMNAVVDAVLNAVFSRKNILALITAIESITGSTARVTPGQMFVGTVSSLESDTNGFPINAIVALHGSSLSAKCYIPPHISPWIQTGQDVFVTAVNGNTSDLIIDSIRNVSTALAPSILTPIVNPLDANEQMGFGLFGTLDAGVSSDVAAAVLGGTGSGVWLKVNNKYNGADVFTAAAQAAQLNMTNTGLQWRVSTNTPVIGATITWGAFQSITIP